MDRREDDLQRSRTRRQNREQFIQSLEASIEEATALEEVVTTRQRVRETPGGAKRPAVARRRSARRELVRMLSSRHTLRQAIILNEIIGLPKALRGDE